MSTDNPIDNTALPTDYETWYGEIPVEGEDNITQEDFDLEKAARDIEDAAQDAAIVAANTNANTRVLKAGDTSTGAQLTTRTPTQILVNDNEFITKAAMAHELLGINNVDGSYLGAQVNGAFNVGSDAKSYWSGSAVQSAYDYVNSKPHLAGAPASMEIRGYAFTSGKQVMPYQGKKSTLVSYDYMTDWSTASAIYTLLNFQEVDGASVGITNSASSQVKNASRPAGMSNQATIVSYNQTTGELVVDNGTAFVGLDQAALALDYFRHLNFPTSYFNSKGGTYTWFTKNKVGYALPATAQVDNLDGTFTVTVNANRRADVAQYAIAGDMVYLGTSGGTYKYMPSTYVSDGVWSSYTGGAISGFDQGGEWHPSKAPDGTAGFSIGLLPNHNSTSGDINNRMWMTNITIDIT